MRHQHDHRHKQRAQAQNEFPREIQRSSALQKRARQPSSQKAPDSGCRIRNPRVVADMLHVEAAHVVEILRQPEEVEVPGRIAHELGEDQHLHLAHAQEHPANDSCLRDQPRVQRGDRSVVASTIADRPPDHPRKPHGSGCEEDHPPSSCQKNDADQRRRQHRAHRRSRIDDPHRRRSLLRRNPLRHDSCRCRKRSAFTHPQQAAGCQQEPEVHRQAMQRAGPRPPQHDQDESPARAHDVQHPSARLHTAPHKESETQTAATRTADR